SDLAEWSGQVEQGAPPGHVSFVGDRLGDEQVQDRRERREHYEHGCDRLEAAASLGRSKNHPHGRYLHGDDEGDCPTFSKRDREHIGDQDQQQHKPVAVRRVEGLDQLTWPTWLGPFRSVFRGLRHQNINGMQKRSTVPTPASCPARSYANGLSGLVSI